MNTHPLLKMRLSLFVRYSLFMLCMHTGAVHAGQLNEPIVDLVITSQPLWIVPQKPNFAHQPYLLRFSIWPRHYTGSAKLEIVFEWPEGYRPSNVVYQVSGGLRDWPIEEYAYGSEDRFDIYLPAMDKGQPSELAIGWVGAPFDESRAYALLTTDTGQVAQQWIGWKLQ